MTLGSKTVKRWSTDMLERGQAGDLSKKMVRETWQQPWSLQETLFYMHLEPLSHLFWMNNMVSYLET